MGHDLETHIGVKAAINSAFIAIWLIFMPEVIMKAPVLEFLCSFLV